MKTALITGGAGFIGTNVTHALLKQGYGVVAIDNFITSTGENSKQFTDNPNYTFLKHDITKPFSKKILNSKFLILNSIFHLACPTGVPNVTKLAEEMLETCSSGTKHILELARQTSASVVFTSSSEVYGDPKAFPQTEAYTGNVDPVGIRSPYEEGKRFAESLVTMYGKKYNVNAKIVRIFNTYGPYMSSNDTRVIPRFMQQIKQGKPLTVQGNGLQTRTFCYIDDLINGLLLVSEKGDPGQVYNLGSDTEVSISELADMIKTLLGTKIKVAYIARPEHDHQRRLPSLEKIKKLGWKQQISLEKGLKKTMDWYRISL